MDMALLQPNHWYQNTWAFHIDPFWKKWYAIRKRPRLSGADRERCWDRFVR